MSSDANLVLAQALDLPTEDRADLAAALWDSLAGDPCLETQGDAVLLEETRKRRVELHSGAVEPITHQELKQRLGR